jgi:hypothetical protein
LELGIWNLELKLMEEQKAVHQKLNIQLLLGNLKIRTMQEDLGKSDDAPNGQALAPSALPVPAPPAQPALNPPLQPETQLSERQLLQKILQQAKESLAQKKYQETISLAQKITQDKSASWFIRFKAKRLINQASEMIEKQKLASASSPEIPSPKQTPAILTKTPSPGAPGQAPVVQSKEAKDLKPPLPMPPQAAQAAPIQTIPAPKPVAAPAFSQPKIEYQQPISSILPSYKTNEQAKKSDQEKKPANKLILAFSAFIFLVLAGAAGYFYFTGALPWPKKPVCQEGQITQKCQCGGQLKNAGFCCNNLWLESDCIFSRPPQTLISSIQQTITIDAQNANSEKILAEAKKAGEAMNQEGAKLIALKISENPPKYATPEETISLLGVTVPSEIKNNTDGLNLLLYFRPTIALASSTEEKQIRLLLVLKQKNQNIIAKALTSWEATLADDMSLLFLEEAGPPLTSDFQTGLYNNGYFRYKKLPVSSITINYTFKNNLIIIGTSKYSIFYAWDALNNTP